MGSSPRGCPPPRQTRRREEAQAGWQWWHVCLLARAPVKAPRCSRCPCTPAGAGRTSGARRRARTCPPRSGGSRRSDRRSAWAPPAIRARRVVARPRRRRQSLGPSLREEGWEAGAGAGRRARSREHRRPPPASPSPASAAWALTRESRSDRPPRKTEPLPSAQFLLPPGICLPPPLTAAFAFILVCLRFHPATQSSPSICLSPCHRLHFYLLLFPVRPVCLPSDLGSVCIPPSLPNSPKLPLLD